MPLPNLPEAQVEIGFYDDPLTQIPDYGIFSNWEDVTPRVRRLSFTRGRSDDLQKIQAGTAEIVLDNRDRALDPMNSSSFYAGFVLPRRQVRISARYPNNPINDNYCWDLIYETAFSTAVGSFSDGGLDYQGNASYDTFNLSASISLTTATNVTVAVRFDRFDVGNYSSSNPLRLFEIPNLCYAYVVSNTVYIKRSSDNTTVATAALPSVVASTNETMWLKFVITPNPINTYIFFCPDQFQTPSSWTDITSTRGAALTFSGTMNSIRPSGPSSAVLAGSTSAWTGIKRLCIYKDSGLATQQQILDLVPQTKIVLYQGYNAGWKQNYGRDGKDNYVTLNCFDAMGLIGNQNLPTDLVQVELDKLIAASRGPWGYWKLGESAKVAIDYTTNFNDMAIGDRVMVAETLASGLQGGSSMFGYDKPGIYAIALTTPYPNVYSGAIAPASFDGSLSFWLNTTQSLAANDGSVLFCMNDSTSGYNSGNGHLLVRLTDTGQIAVDMYNTTSFAWGSYGQSTTVVNNGISHFVTITTSGTTSKLYIDGILESTFTAKPYWGGYIGIGGYAKAGLAAFDSTVRSITNFFFKGLMQDVTLWNGVTLTATEITNIYQAGFGSIEELTGPRVSRVLDSVGIPSWMKAINTTTYGLCGATDYTEDQRVLDAINKIEDTEQGVFYVNREGKFAFLNRYYLSTVDTGINAQASFDDVVTNIGYRNLEFTYDADQLINDHIVTDDVGEQYQSADDTSITTYGRTSRTIDTLLIDTDDARDMALGLTNIYKAPILRAQPFEIVPIRKQWLNVLPLDLGMRMNIKCTPLDVGSQINQDLALQQLSYSVENKQWSVEVIGSPRPVISYFVLGDGTVETRTRTNLATNPSFETNTTGWSASGSGTGAIATSTAQALFGTNSVARTVTATGTAYVQSGLIAVTEGLTYTLSAYVRATAARNCYVLIQWRTAANAFISNTTGTGATCSTTAWTRYNVTGVAPATAAFAYIYLTTDATNGDTIYWDGVLLEQASALDTYFDGSIDPYQYGGPATRTWTGTAHASTSTRSAPLMRINLINNPSFETNADLWGGGGTAFTTLARSTAQARIGVASLAATATSAGNIRAYYSGLTGSAVGTAATRVAVSAGLTYTLTAWTRAATVARLTDVIIEFYDSAGAVISSPETADVLNSTTSWTQAPTLTTTAPANAITATISVRMQGAAISEVHYIDSVMLEQSSTVNSYFDGANPGSTSPYIVSNYYWTGTAQASQSVMELSTPNNYGSKLDGPDVLGF